MATACKEYFVTLFEMLALLNTNKVSVIDYFSALLFFHGMQLKVNAEALEQFPANT